MKFDQFNWFSGLDESGWIALALFVTFFIITMITLVMMLKLRLNSKKNQPPKPLEDLQQPVAKPVTPANSPVPAKAEVKNIKKADDYSNPVEEAKVFLDYGLNKQAINLLAKYLKENPSDKIAREMLIKAQQ